ncbi:DUF2599 domain-containing protein [Pseudomonas sp.]|uniref:DUF2599 domain-containing protein n=1 Tax=Pseudomonas sp. TaxID=306 RepID=UPI003CC533C8
MSKHPRASTLFTAVMSTLALLPMLAQAQDLGDTTARALQQRYDDSRTDCGSDTTPAFLCSGVMVFPIPLQAGNQEWNLPQPNNGAASFSFLRQDAPALMLHEFTLRGFVFYPVLDHPEGKITSEIRCAFPVVGQASERLDAGCGSHPAYPNLSGSCHRIGITTAAQWLAHFSTPGITEPNLYQCGFSTRDSDNADAPQRFRQAIAAHNLLGPAPAMNLVVSAWQQDSAPRLPIQAFIYMNDAAREKSMADQAQFKADSGGVLVPVIRLETGTNQTLSVFKYRPQDQSEPLPPDPGGYPRDITRRCANYIDHVQWSGQGNTASLSITPTDCARQHIPEPEHAFAVDELVDRWASDARFINARGMRDQFRCLMVTYPDKPEWNIEPWRPDVGYQATLAADCNP